MADTGLNALWDKIPKFRKDQARQALVNAWEHPKVKRWLNEMGEAVTPEMKKNASSKVLEYIRALEDPNYIPHLELYQGGIVISYSKRNTPLVKMTDDGIRRNQVYDQITKNLQNVSDETYISGGIPSIDAEGAVDRFVNNYEYGNKEKGCWIMGRRGVGKTYLMAYMCSKFRGRRVGFNFTNTTELYQTMLNRMRNNSKELDGAIWDLKKAEVLILDDMGAEPRSQFMINQVLYSILDYRMNAKLPTWFTSNFTIIDYRQHLLASPINGVSKHDIYRLVERIETLAKEIQMYGENRREKQ